MNERANPPSWLTPQLVIQILTIIITLATAWAAISNRLANLQEKLVAIENRLPSREVLDIRLDAMEKQIATLGQRVDNQDAWVRNTRERLAEKGWKP